MVDALKTTPLNVVEVGPQELGVRLQNRSKILRFEELLSQVEGASFGDMRECPLKHSFVDGIYVREILIPKGTVLTGKIHRHEHPNFLMSGDVTVVTEGGGLERLKAPQAMISAPGTKRVVIANEDTIWITVHHNPQNLTDLGALEEMIIAPSYEALEERLLCRG